MLRLESPEESASLQGSGPGPGAAAVGAGPHPGRAGRYRPAPSVVCAPGAVGPLFCALRVPLAPGPLPLRGPLRRGAPAAAVAAPVRAFRPSASLRRGRAPGVPPGSTARACAPLRGSCASRWPRCAWGRPPPAAGFLRVPLLRSVLPAALRVAPPGPPLPVRCRGFGPGGFRPRGLRGLRPLSPASGPGAFGCAPRLRGLRCLCCGCCGGRGLLPLPPPRPCAPRWGAAGSAWPPALGAPAPALRAPPVGAAASAAIPAALPLSAPRQGFPSAGLRPGLDPVRVFCVRRA